MSNASKYHDARTANDKLCQKHDAHRHELYKTVSRMWEKYQVSASFRSDNPEHQRVIGGLDKSNNYLWEQIGRQSPFEIVRDQMKKKSCHVSCKRSLYPLYTEYTLYANEIDESKVEEPLDDSDEKTDAKFAQGCRMHDAMKHQLRDFVTQMHEVLVQTNAPVTWCVSDDCDASARVVGALDKKNQKMWDYIGRKSPFVIVAYQMKRDFGCHLSVHFLQNAIYGDRPLTTFQVTLDKYRQPKKDQVESQQDIQQDVQQESQEDIQQEDQQEQAP
jgi:hypothetical protein